MNQQVSILQRFGTSILHGVIALLIAFIIFSLAERLFQFRSLKKSRRATALDLQYVLLSMLYPPFIYFFLSIIFGYLVAVQLKANPHDPHISWLTFAVQLAVVLVLRDCLIYLRHRFFHLGPVWAYHSIHHSSEDVNWLSAARFHPAENLIEAGGEALLFICFKQAGVDPAVLFVAVLFIAFYNYFIHSNLRWTFGPLRYVFVSPVFHRWHHSDLPAARDKNFAAMFSFLDLGLGTFYMPKNLMPETTGLSAEEKAVHPRTLAGQLLYPFRK